MIPEQAFDSIQAGFLQPLPPDPNQDDAGLENFLQQYVAGVVGLDGTMVRPRWQVEPPTLPVHDADWAAIGITRIVREPFAWIGGSDPATDQLQRHEVIDLLISFYGPHCSSYISRLTDGLQLPQNRETLLLHELGFVETGEVTRVPELIQSQWINREDVTFRVRRRVVRTYPVLSVLEAQARIITETVQHDFHAPPARGG